MTRGKWKTLGVACVASFAALAGSASAPSAPTRPVVAVGSLSHGVLLEVNAFRRSHGLGALRLSSALSVAAAQHSTEMARVGYFAHTSANGGAFDKRLARFYPMGSYRYWGVGENLVYASPDLGAGEALKLWANSPLT